jgi:thioester reductase-like protein
MPRIFITGANGYLGGYVCTRLLQQDPETRLALLIRSKSAQDAIEKLWDGWQLHLTPEAFEEAMARVDVIPGDLHAEGLGISKVNRKVLADTTESVIHIAASLNRKSEHACLNTNLRGTLSVLTLASEMNAGHGLRRFSLVSTAAVAGERHREIVLEDQAIDWNRRQYDPYARTKAFTELMTREVLPQVPLTIFRPSSVLGDSRHSRTTQWDMVRAFVFFSELPALPWGPDVRQDIVNADFVGDAIAALHQKKSPLHDCYHLSAGTGACSTQAITTAMVADTGRRPPRFSRRLQGPFASTVSALDAGLPKGTPQRIAGLLKVFLPYVTNDTVFDNGRAVAEVGHAPVPFTQYCGDLYRYARANDFKFPGTPLPADIRDRLIRATPLKLSR